MYRTDIISFLIKKNNYKTYLEIGCAGNRNFKSIPATHKVGVDPVRGGTVRKTSDEFFLTNKENFDIVLVDGLHHADQAYRDIINSLRYLNDNGTIVVHDTNPANENAQIVPRLPKQREWNGDVWRAWVYLRSHYPKLISYVINTDEGVGIVQNPNMDTKSFDIPYVSNANDISYGYFDLNRKELLNLISVDDFLKL